MSTVDLSQDCRQLYNPPPPPPPNVNWFLDGTKCRICFTHQWFWTLFQHINPKMHFVCEILILLIDTVLTQVFARSLCWIIQNWILMLSLKKLKFGLATKRGCVGWDEIYLTWPMILPPLDNFHWMYFWGSNHWLQWFLKFWERWFGGRDRY